MKYELGLCTRRLSLCVLASASDVGFKRSTILHMVPGGGAERERESEKSTSTGKSKITVGDQESHAKSTGAACGGETLRGQRRAIPRRGFSAAAESRIRRLRRASRADRDRHSHCNEGDNLNLMDGGQWLDGLSWP